MITTLWIDRDDVANYKQIADTNFDNKLNDLVRQAQYQDVRPLLGERLFDDINNNLGSYTDLLNGGTYTYDGETYTNEGLKAVTVYYFYARYAMFGANIDTPFSMVNKLNNDKSTPLDYNQKKAIYSNERDMAFNIWRSVEKYLIRTENPLFNSGCSKKQNNFRFSKITKNDDYYKHRRYYIRD